MESMETRISLMGVNSAGKSIPVLLTDAGAVNFDITTTHTHVATEIGSGDVSATEFEYLNGVTSAIQTQLDAKVAIPGSSAAGDILYHNGTTYVRLAKGTAGQVLTMNAGATAPEWKTP